jgi:aspartate carbamoyltransferase catalytic subunit
MAQVKVHSIKHLIGLKGMSEQEITSILDRAFFWEQYPA